ncbi:MAG: hypothetical protein AB1796_07675 [Bacillota bacterium]
MFSAEIIQFLRNHFPVHLSEVRAAVDLLVYSVDDAIEAIIKKGNALSTNKELQEAIIFLEKAGEMEIALKTLQNYMNQIETEDDSPIFEDEILDNIEKQNPNYDEYSTDRTTAYTLFENYTYKRPHAFEMINQTVNVRDWKDMLMETCKKLTKINKDLILRFPDDPKFNGKKISYFSDKPETMRSPRRIETLDLFVETNFSANHIRNLIIKMLNHYGIPLSEYKIYLRADYSPLHK